MLNFNIERFLSFLESSEQFSITMITRDEAKQEYIAFASSNIVNNYELIENDDGQLDVIYFKNIEGNRLIGEVILPLKNLQLLDISEDTYTFRFIALIVNVENFEPYPRIIITKI